MKEFYAVIMAGGKGERFWPLSTGAHPKQLISLFGGVPLVRLAVDRLTGLIPPDRVFILTTADLADAVREAVPGVPADQIVGEPVGRDTAATVALGAALVGQRGVDAAFCVLTADQLMSDLDRFRQTLRSALDLALESNMLITIGMAPAYPSTGFGYVEAGERVRERDGIVFFRAKRFVEKPDRARAESYLASGSYYWNSGMFVWSVDAIRKALAAHAPRLEAMSRRLQAIPRGAAFDAALSEEFGRLPKISIDYAVMEKVPAFWMARGDFGWDDVGTWLALENHFPKDAAGNVRIGEVEALDAKGNIVVSEGRLTALVGVENLVVVQADGVTLVCARDRAQDVRQVVQSLREGGRHGRLL